MVASSPIFREYDIRGVADRDLGDELVERIGCALGTLLKPEGVTRPLRIAVGRDCRLSSDRLFRALTSGLVAGGIEVIDVGVGPTPKLYFAVNHLDTDGGVMITGSHNPAQDNGMKIMKGKASFFGEQIQALGTLAQAGPPKAPKPGSIRSEDVDDAYVARLNTGLDFGKKDFRIVVDAGNGSAGPLGVRALETAGFRPVTLFCEMDGRFPNHHPDPTVPKNVETLVARVRSEQALVGIAWDGDGDRLGVVDRTGEIVWGDRLLALFARSILERTPGAAVIADVKCSQTLFTDVARHGGKPVMWKTGHSLIKTKMKEEHAAVAGEMSGHFFFADRYYGYDDAIYAALRLLEILSRAGKSVLELLSDMPRTVFTPELRVDCPDTQKFAVVERVRQELASRGEVNALDGARVTYADGAWALVRASNTGPVLVMRFEAPNEQRLEEIRADVERVVSQAKSSLGTPAPR
jgi:phosphomannomutase / phosphoglucomutase